MARTNYAYEKRQRELAKKQKKEEKAREKAGRRDLPADGTQPEEGEGAEGAGAENAATGAAGPEGAVG